MELKIKVKYLSVFDPFGSSYLGNSQIYNKICWCITDRNFSKKFNRKTCMDLKYYHFGQIICIKIERIIYLH